MSPSQSMIVDAFQSATYIPDRMDVQHTPIYDTVAIAAAGNVNPLTTAFFTNVGPASGKTLALTNMSQQQRLAAPQAFSIFAIRLRIAENILRLDLDTILNQFCLEVFKGEKCYNRAPLWYYAAGGGISGFTTWAGESAYNNGLPGRESMHKLAVPIVLENQETFWANYQGAAFALTAAAAGGTGLFTVCLLDGLYARGVQ